MLYPEFGARVEAYSGKRVSTMHNILHSGYIPDTGAAFHGVLILIVDESFTAHTHAQHGCELVLINVGT